MRSDTDSMCVSMPRSMPSSVSSRATAWSCRWTHGGRPCAIGLRAGVEAPQGAVETGARGRRVHQGHVADDVNCLGYLVKLAAAVHGSTNRSSGAAADRSARFHSAMVLEGLLLSFPFHSVGFHADDGERVHQAARSPNCSKSSCVERFTGSRARMSGDNALVEGRERHASSRRRSSAFGHIPWRFDADVERGPGQARLVAVRLNFHRPCLFATKNQLRRRSRSGASSSPVTSRRRKPAFRSRPNAQVQSQAGAWYTAPARSGPPPIGRPVSTQHKPRPGRSAARCSCASPPPWPRRSPLDAPRNPRAPGSARAGAGRISPRTPAVVGEAGARRSGGSP